MAFKESTFVGMDLVQVADRLSLVVSDAVQEFQPIDEAEWSMKVGGVWSRKEILGHLTDSAANNHLRIVRAQLADSTYVSFRYEQDFFVESQHYNDRKAADVINLWSAYNQHLAHIIRYVDPNKLSIMCAIGSDPIVTLSFLIKDYVGHVEHHLEQLFSR